MDYCCCFSAKQISSFSSCTGVEYCGVRAGSIARRAEQQRMRTNKMLLAVVAVFAVTWTPFHAHSVIAEFRHDLVLGRFFKLGDVLCRVLAFSSACVNPVLYGWMNDHYRAAFIALVTRRRKLSVAGGRSPARPGSIGLRGSIGDGERSRERLAVRSGNFEELPLTPTTKYSMSQPQIDQL